MALVSVCVLAEFTPYAGGVRWLLEFLCTVRPMIGGTWTYWLNAINGMVSKSRDLCWNVCQVIRCKAEVEIR